MILRKRGTINYLSNSELLYEINKSKLTYCYFIDKKYAQYSVIIRDFSEINDELIEQAKIKKANQINAALARSFIIDKVPSAIAAERFKVEKTLPENITKEDIVFRYMTFEHIPEKVKKDKKTLLNRIHFPPFKHYSFVGDELKEVGRSHWQNGLDNGEYSDRHGKMSLALAKALMKIVDRYSSRANFCGYSYLEDMRGQALLQLSTVALQFDESKSDNPFAWYTTTIKTSFLKILKSEKKMRNIRDELMITAGFDSSYGHQLDNEDGD